MVHIEESDFEYEGFTYTSRMLQPFSPWNLCCLFTTIMIIIPICMMLWNRNIVVPSRVFDCLTNWVVVWPIHPPPELYLPHGKEGAPG